MENAAITAQMARVRIIVKKRNLYYTEINYNGSFEKEDESDLMQTIKERYKDADSIFIEEIDWEN